MKKVRVLIAVIAAFTMLFSSQVYASYYDEEATETPIPPAKKNPVISVVDPLIVEMNAGDSKTVELSLKNLTNDTAKSIVTEITVPAGTGITAVFEKNDSVVATLGSKVSRKVKLNLTVNETTKEGIYDIQFSHKFFNALNEDRDSTSSIQVRVINSAVTSSLSMKDIKSSLNQVPQGSEFTVTASIQNEGTSDVKDVNVTIDGLESKGIFLKNSTNVVSFDSVAKGMSESVSIQLEAYEKMAAGSYPLTIKLTYKDDDSETEKTKTYTYYVNVSDGTSSKNTSQMVITNISSPTGILGVAEDFDMIVTIKNTSNFTAKNVKITAKPEGEGAVVPKSTSIMQLGDFAAGATRDISFRFAATSTSKSQNYVVGFTVDYENGKETSEGETEVISYTQYQGVNVSNPEADKDDDEEEKISTPKIIIKEYVSNPIIVEAGHEFDLTMTFLNTSSEKPIKNIKAFLTVDEDTEKKGNVFSPVNSSNTFYIDKVSPKGEVSKEIRLYTVPDASPKTYTINVNFEYEDMDNNEYKTVEIVGINVKQVTELQTSDISIAEYAQIGEQIYINFELYNTGKVTLSNLMIKIEGNFESTQSSSYFGSFSASSTEYYDNSIIPMEEGRQEGAIVISYEDDAGEKIERLLPFTIEVAPMPEYENMGMELEPGMMIDPETGMIVPEKTGLSTPVMIGLGVVVVAGAAIGIVIAVKMKKKKGSIDLDE